MEAFPQWIILLIVVIVLARMAVFLARRFGLPSTSIQLLIGVLLGPSVFNLLGVPMVLGTWGSPSSGPLHSALRILAEIGLIQLMFLAGLGVDWRELKKMLKLSFSVGTWGFLLTAVSVAIITRVFVDRWSEAMAVSAIVAAPSFGISIYYFNEMKGLDSRVKVTVLGAAISSGLLAILLMIASQATSYAMIYGPSKMSIAVSWFLAKLIMFFAVAYFLTSRFLKLSSKSGFQKRPRQMLVGYLLLVAALYAWASMHFGSFAAVGVASLARVDRGFKLWSERQNRTTISICAGFAPHWGAICEVGMGANLKEMGATAFLGCSVCDGCRRKVSRLLDATRKTPELRSDRPIAIATCHRARWECLAAYLFSRGLVDPLNSTLQSSWWCC
jgi:NhaP-type Na+/H+ or K+/H+ antiporter